MAGSVSIAHRNVGVTEVSVLYTVQTYFFSELCEISTDCENFWHKDSKENKLYGEYPFSTLPN